ncbi:RagB/SusD family nutrient uptake outer membrane protein [Chitinophaga parva]|uniref:RagB/SusD family nutrient uptake outer membrane protein n=1 Tax=Chitinophaga parva TaxID=2169414 RepID=A0A2T7BFD0_9BACT|nr:RagB/SusD family nutrient uptake outer membrane protein [Chitinophaga parva]PUZ24990.1 RagB/SusD family nutrient uptake outer membrane protein [Chitinophaga parva]
MKFSVKHILVIAVLLMGSACKKFLEENPTGFISPSAPLAGMKVARAFADGCYQDMQGLLNGQNSSYGGNTWNLMEFATGKSNSDLGQTGFAQFQNLSYSASSFYMDTWWQHLYQGVGACNSALGNLPRVTGIDDSSKTALLGEAHAMRAFYYFYLVRMFGAVPMVSETPTSSAGLKLKRTDAKTIYDNIIIPDLLEAEKVNFPWRDVNGRVSKGMVESLLADVYLTYAGAAINGGAANYAESAKRSKNVLDNGGYNLFNDYHDMTIPANKNSQEFIFQIQYAASVPSTNPLTPLTIPNYSGISKYSDEYGSVYPTPQFLASFPAGDHRLDERQFFYSKYKSSKGSDTVKFRTPYIYKWFDSVAVVNTTKSDLNYTIYRLADVELMYAEASNRAEGGPNAQAIKVVNDIRKRAHLAPLGTLSQDAFEKEVWLERYFELCFENKMWFDMVRTLKVHNDVTGNWDNFVGHKTVYNATFSENQRLFPVPQQEIDVNPNLLPNNPGF